MIRIINLSYAYTQNKKILFPDFEIAQGEPCLLLGESGSGKTTLLHLLGGLLKAQEGNIVLNNTDITILTESALDHFRGKNLGFIFQKNHLIAALTVKQNLLMAPFLAQLPQDKNRVEEVLNSLGLSDKHHVKIQTLSQGQAQRVAIARAVFNKPSIILADEPTSALDDKNCDRVITLLMDVAQKNNSTLIVATHDQRLKNKINKQIQLN
jgi:ABC-type lipoprotein export system ATPase subunit